MGKASTVLVKFLLLITLRVGGVIERLFPQAQQG
jgi:hypothetical protein